MTKKRFVSLLLVMAAMFLMATSVFAIDSDEMQMSKRDMVTTIACNEADACADELAASITNSRVEKSHDNDVVYNTWFYSQRVSGENFPWQATFVSWVLNEAGCVKDGTSINTASVPTLYKCLTDERGYAHHPLLTSYVFAGLDGLMAGDLLFFSHNNHVGIIVDVTPTSISVVEGNRMDAVHLVTYTAKDLEQPILEEAEVVRVVYLDEMAPAA